MKKVIVVVELTYPDDVDVRSTGRQLANVIDDAFQAADITAGDQMYVASGPTAQVVLDMFITTEGL